MTEVLEWNPSDPFNVLTPLPPESELESKAVLKQCIAARVALAELKQSAALMPNPAVLLNTLPVVEAAASSAIDGNVTGPEALFVFQHAEGAAEPATLNALRAWRALADAWDSRGGRPTATRLAVTVCSRITGVAAEVRSGRTAVQAGGPGGRTTYTPPEGEHLIRDLLANWERFLDSERDLDPLLRIAVAHYQFEAIHPFASANGCTGRVLSSLLLVQEGLLPAPVLCLSLYLLAQQTEYHRLLLEVTRTGEWESWLLFLLRGMERTAQWTIGRIAAIRQLSIESAAKIRKDLPKLYSPELVDTVFAQPCCRIAHLVDSGIAGRQAASRYLKSLASIGVLREQSLGKDKLFVNDRLIKLLAGSEQQRAA